jgi:MarR family transcriptional regulator, organic hydroperoxide resistance regulator
MPMAMTETALAELDLARLLTLVERRVTAKMATALSAAGGSVEVWRVLSLLADGRGHPMTEIAAFALLPPPTLTKVVDRMVSDNLVYRRVDEADRRRVLVFLSSRGRTVYGRMAAAIEDERDGLAAAAGKEELALLGALLARVAERLG